MKIFIGSDHRGFDLKEQLKLSLKRRGFTVEDVGNFFYDPYDDYPDFAQKVGQLVSRRRKSFGVVICGSGVGVCIAANKVRGVRAVLAFSDEVAKVSRRDENTNVLCLGADFISPQKALRIIQRWLKTPFSNQIRHRRRVRKLNRIIA